MNHFTKFFRIYVPEQYRRLVVESLAAYGALYGRYREGGPNPWLAYDHGLLWKLWRDLAVFTTTFLRFWFGLAVLVVVTLAIPVAVLLRAIAIPIVGLVKGLSIASKLKGMPNESKQ